LFKILSIEKNDAKIDIVKSFLGFVKYIGERLDAYGAVESITKTRTEYFSELSNGRDKTSESNTLNFYILNEKGEKIDNFNFSVDTDSFNKNSNTIKDIVFDIKFISNQGLDKNKTFNSKTDLKDVYKEVQENKKQ